MSELSSHEECRVARQLADALSASNYDRVKALLPSIDVLDSVSIVGIYGRPLYRALFRGAFQTADLLIAHGASPNFLYSDWKSYILIFSYTDKHAVHYLLQRGSWIPRSIWNNPWVTEYTGRSWDSSNHASWPDSVRAQMQTLLLITGIPRGMPLRRDLLFYLFQWVLSAYWTLVDG